MHNFRHKKVILNSETMKSPPPSNTPRGSMCVHVFWGRGIFICGVCLEKISRDSPIIHVFFVFVFVNSNGYQLPRSRRYMFHKVGGGGGDQVMRKRKDPPPPPPILRKWGRGKRGDRNLIRQLILLTSMFLLWQCVLIDCCVLGRFCNVLFLTLSLFNECVQSCVNFKVITCNCLIKDEFLFHVIYNPYHLLS